MKKSKMSINQKMKSKNKVERILPITLKDTRIAYEEWFSDTISDYLDLDAIPDEEAHETILRHCCFFVTMTFDRNVIFELRSEKGIGFGDYSIEFDNLNYLYNRVASEMFGPNWMKMEDRSNLPLVIACMDFEGSKYAMSNSWTTNNPHIHAMWVVRPAHLDAFKKVLESVRHRFRTLDRLHCDELEVVAYDPEKQDAGGLGSYVSKMLIKTTREAMSADLIRIYPDMNFGDGTYKAAHKYKTRSKSLEKARKKALLNRK